ncbi:MAG: bifunctional glutamate N-acetyltransferase/amino-acid acetyltransferase ArgJ [Actinomycetes bacterium]
MTGVGVTVAAGFRAAGVAGGLKASGGRDVALVVNDGPDHSAAGVFTSNRVHAAPVAWSREVLATGQVRAVVLNSGGANACTGTQGWLDTVDAASVVAAKLDVPADQVAVCSTGLIGERLAMPALRSGIAAAVGLLDGEGGQDAAEAIMTTDSVAKTASAHGTGFAIGGMAKGAGMLAPGLATMLSVLTTDAVVPAALLDDALREVTARTFDRIDSDGCMSTNDSVLLLSSGANGVAPTQSELVAVLDIVCHDLARQLVADAEGASKDIRIDVVGAKDEADATEVARAVARSNLFKCAVHGEDPNWGRVLSAVGTTSAQFHPENLAVAINGVWVSRDGGPGDDRALVDMSGRDIVVTVDLSSGESSSWVWTNDLTAAYVHENSAYSS